MRKLQGRIAALGAGTLAGRFLKDSISAASDLNETVSKSQQVFGASSRAVEEFAKSAATSIGQSRQAALDASATFGNMFDGFGFGEEQAAKFSIQMVKLASDFASFHNARPEDVVQALTSAFRGEFDPLQRFVPTIKAAAVEQKALELGLARTTKELTTQDKALATYQFVLDNAGAAAGDFARTSDGLANQQRILTANWADAKATLGAQLLPAMTEFVTFLNESALPAVTRFKDSVHNLFGDASTAPGNFKKGIATLKEFFKNPIGFAEGDANAALARQFAAIDNAQAEVARRKSLPGSAADALDVARKNLAGSTDKLTGAQQSLAGATAATAAQDEKATAAADRLKNAQNALAAAHRRVADAAFDVLDAEDDLREAQFRQGVGSEEAIKAQRVLDRARLREADARADVGERGDAVAKANQAIAETLPTAVDKFAGAVNKLVEANLGAIAANKGDTGNLVGAPVINFHGITDHRALADQLNRELDWSARRRAGRGGRAMV